MSSTLPKSERSFSRWWKKNNTNYGAILFDVDGTLISGRHALPGAVELLDNLRNSQFPFCLLTNDGNHSPEEKAGIMQRRGLKVETEDIVSCGHAIASLAKRRNYIGKKLFAMGELGQPDFAEIAGLKVVRNPEKINSCIGIIVGEGDYNWQKNITAAINYYIKNDSRVMIVPNPDSYWPSGPNSIGIGAGGKARFLCTILKEYGITIQPVYLGKPYKPVYSCALKMLRERFGLSRNVTGKKILMLGDSLLSDIRGAKRAGYSSGLLLTGITSKVHLKNAKPHCIPDFVFKSLS